jgi:5-methyltetrahydropteroyltriglutamate--homocysteine methyltransferase
VPVTFKFRGDQVGSLLRPPALLDARRRAETGEISTEELWEAENEAIAAAVKMQKEAGLDVFTDGEFRRADFRAGIVDAFDGITAKEFRMPWHGPDGMVKLPGTAYIVSGRLQQRRRITEGEAGFLRSVTSRNIKMTLIAPGFVAEHFWRDGVTDKVYGSRAELGAEIAAFMRAEVEALFAEGVRYVQFDNPAYSEFLSSHIWSGDGAGEKDDAFARMLAADAAAVDGVRRPEGASIGMHVCRGNNSSRWLAEGGYDPIAERLFSSLPVDRFLLEFDDDRAGGFEPLRYVPQGKVVVLGLVSTKTPQLEDVDEVVARIDEAAQYVDIDNLAVSPQCGFASVAKGGNKLSQQDQFRKLRVVADAAISAWGLEG